MENKYTALLENLDIQLAIYNKLFSLANEKQPVLVSGNIPELERITREEEFLIIQVGRLEEKRKVIHQELANHFKLSPEELDIEEIIKRTDDKTASDLQSIISKVSGVLTQLGHKNKTNTELIKNSLDFVNFSLNILTGDSIKPAYSGEKKEKQNINSKIFDRTV